MYIDSLFGKKEFLPHQSGLDHLASAIVQVGATCPQRPFRRELEKNVNLFFSSDSTYIKPSYPLHYALKMEKWKNSVIKEVRRKEDSLENENLIFTKKSSADDFLVPSIE